MKPIEYIGCFFDAKLVQQFPAEKREGPLFRVIGAPHVTLVYEPTEVPTALFGTKVSVKVIGYGCDGKNEALRVEFADLPQELMSLAANVSVPHITLSVAADGKPVESRFLTFGPVEPFFLEGVFGGMDVDGLLHLAAE